MTTMTSCHRLVAVLLGLIALGLAGGARSQQPPYVCVETNLGEFCLRLLHEQAPQTVENFLNYVEDGDYDDTFIHRSVPAALQQGIIQGGGYYVDPLGQEVPKDEPVPNENSTASNVRGTVAMARFSDDPDSATSEWFVNLTDNTDLDFQNGGFTVFAVVERGMSVVDDIGDSQRADLSGSLGAAFGEVPVLRKPEEGIGVEDLILVNRVYTTDTLPEEEPEEEDPSQGGEEDPAADFDALTFYSNGSFIIPVRVGDNLYQVIMNLVADDPTYIFEVDTSRIVPQVSTDGEVATFNRAAGVLTVPSIRTAEDQVFINVTFTLTDSRTLEFTLEGFERL